MSRYIPPATHRSNAAAAAANLRPFYSTREGLRLGQVPESGGGTPGEPGGATPTILWDGFESANMSAPDGPAPYLNRDGFTWGANNKTSVVTTNEDGNVAVWNNGAIYNANTDPAIDWAAKTGDHSLRFRYTAMPNGEWTEQRFALGDVYPELWLSWWLRVPVNYSHIGALQEYNHKLFYIWQSGYTSPTSTHGPTIGMEIRGDGNGGSQVQGSGVPFISVPEDRGRWMHFVVNVKQNSAEGVADGRDRVWRRWEGETTYDVLRNSDPANLETSTITGEQGWREGYLMGWANGGHVEATEWLIDDFKISETSLLEE